MRTRIKVCGITTIEALNACVNAGVDAVGFVFAESPRRLGPGEADALIFKVPPFVSRVGVFKNPGAAEVSEVIAAVRLSLLQADVDDFPAFLTAGCRQPMLPVYRFGTTAFDELMTKVPPGRSVLIEGAASGSGQTLDWEKIAPLARLHRVVLAGGLTPANVGEAIRIVRPFAVDVSSGVESSRGVKDAGLIAAFASAVRAADAAVEGVSA